MQEISGIITLHDDHDLMPVCGFQWNGEEIRKSPLWNELVKAFGETKAEELLEELCVKKG